MIRPYEARDFEDCLYLQEICYLKPCSESELRAKLETGKCWVWEDRPLVIGCLILEGNLVWSVTVAENWRRKGIATALLLEAEKHVRPLHLHTEPFSAGQKLYTKLGYTASKIERDYYGQGLDAILMVKR
jgi:ribosomal protein S18 acetylase RimI-like enzyme